MDNKPNFSEYSHHELLDVIQHIDKDTYPGRYQEVEALLNNKDHLPEAKAEYNESIELDKYSTFWPRCWAAIIDGFIFVAILYVECLFFGVEYDVQDKFLQALNAIQLTVYIILMHGLFGQTVGKMFMNVKVLDYVTESDIDIKQALRRESVNLIINIVWASIILLIAVSIDSTGSITVSLSYMILGFTLLAFVWGISEFITMLLNDKRRAVHDFIGRTVVVRT